VPPVRPVVVSIMFQMVSWRFDLFREWNRPFVQHAQNKRGWPLSRFSQPLPRPVYILTGRAGCRDAISPFSPTSMSYMDSGGGSKPIQFFSLSMNPNAW